ncbi:MAG TPA: hypothetical protein VGS41_00870, partial [Chthonomonadales bacterium]|nr:hypothetical protein [Chthonomonadales bacterium]
RAYRTHPHYAIFHHDIPKIVAEEDPSKAHWLSSPWSPDYKNPTDPTVGDQHPWQVSLRDTGGADWWKYRTHIDRFANEGGVLGSSSPATLRQFLPETERHLLSASWAHHDNPWGRKGGPAGELGRAYQTVAMWTGLDPLHLDLDRYAFVSGLLQAEGLQEYILNYRRRMFSSAAAIFWMYNDSWPVTHGWTIVDYYCRKKLAYHPVRRAFAPVTVVAAEEGRAVTIYGVNELEEDWTGELRWGVFRLGGGFPLDKSERVTLAANGSTALARFPLARWEIEQFHSSGAFAALYREGDLIAQHRLFLARFKDLRFGSPNIRIERHSESVTFMSDQFVWGVCLDAEGEARLADNLFDLLPGIPYRVPWRHELGQPVIVRTGSTDATR